VCKDKYHDKIFIIRNEENV